MTARWKSVAALAVAVPALVAGGFMAATPAQAAVGIHVSGTQILEKNGSPLILRGTSHAHVWYQSQTSSIANIKAAGANAVRVVLGGGRWGPNSASDVANVISLCKASKLICILEDHDTTGYGEQSGAYTLAQAAQYWVGLKSVLQGQEDYVIVNIGNEPIGNNNPSQWTSATIDAIKTIRSAGISNALMVDAPSWGQDWAFVMRDNAKTVFAADSQANTIFSVHMYGVYDTAAEITAYVGAFQSNNLPLVIGEFGFNHSDGDPDEATIMAQSIGWLGWSWSGNGGGVEYLDQVTNFDPNQMTSWGTQLFSKIKATAKEATIYSGGGGSTTTTTTRPTTTTTRATTTTTRATTTTTRPTTTSTSRTTTTTGGGGGGGCTATGTTNQWNGGFVQNVTVQSSGSTSGWKVTINLPSGASVANGWNAQLSGSTGTVTATNMSYNGNAGGGGASFGFQGTGSASGISFSCTAS
jgi:mannan endo-1,4-beta-mannosidase